MKQLGLNLNTKQKDILTYLYTTIEKERICPSVREICKALGIKSTATVYNHLNKLMELGYVEKNTLKKRALRITDLGNEFCRLELNLPIEEDINYETSYIQQELTALSRVPLVGTVQAGMPITAIENREDEYILPQTLTGKSDCFLLTVQGDSMKNIGIYEGDKILVRQQPIAENGDIVVARIGDEATVKRFFKEKDHIRLQPENDLYEPIIVNDCIIEGKVISLIRENI